MTDFLDFDALKRRSSPNQWLVAPADFRPDLPIDGAVPVLALPAAQLAEQWVAVVRDQPRAVLLGVSGDGLQVEAEQRSALFRFVDAISFRAMSIDHNTSTFIAYSRSHLGYWDVGVNRRRLMQWTAALSR